MIRECENAVYSRTRGSRNPEILRSLWTWRGALFSLHGMFFVFPWRHQEREYISRDACGISVLVEAAKEEVNGDRACGCVHT